MTVTTTLDRQYFNGDGSNKVFPFNFRFFANDQIYVSLIAPDGTITPQNLTTNYTLAGALQAGGGVVTMLVAPPLTSPATQVFIQRIVAEVQPTSIRNQGRFFPEVHEDVFDRLTMLAQQALSGVRNSLQLLASKVGWDFRGYKGVNVGDGTAEQDAVNIRTMRSYVDDAVSGVIGGFGWFIQNATGAVYRTFQDKMRDTMSVKDFGAIGNGISNDTAAVQAMILAVGYASFTRGSYLLTTATFDAPINFDMGASLSLALGQTLTITGPIDSPKQYIFRGAGSYLLRNDLDSGENSQQVHVSWFGAFPTVRTEIDQAPFIAKCFAALDNTREAEVYFDKGRYHIGAALTVPRATAVIGEGSRRTVFGIMSDGFDVFTTQANGCRFQGFQFEVSLNIVSGYRASGCYIRISQQLCDVYDVWLGQATQSIVITAGQCRIFNIASTYSQSVGSGSSLVSIQASDVNIEQVLASKSTTGPDSIIEIGGVSASNITGVTIENVNWGSASTGVLVSTSARILTNITIQGLRFRGSAGFPAPELVKLITTGVGTLSDVIIDGVSGNANSTNCITIAQGSSVSTSRVSISNVKSSGTAGYGVSLVRTAGTLSRVVIADTVSVPLYATPFVQTGTMSEVSISPIATPGSNAAYLSEQTLADDAFFSIDLKREVFTGMLCVTVGSTQFGVFIVRTSPAETIATMFAPSANMNSQTGVLNGTTGVDGKFTVSVSNNVLYFENRLGFSQPVNVVQLFGAR